MSRANIVAALVVAIVLAAGSTCAETVRIKDLGKVAGWRDNALVGYGLGVALAGKYLDKLPYKIWALLGDSEMAEGSIWEAFDHASHYKLNNLIGILDCNRLGQRGETDLGWNTVAYAARAEAFGWNAIVIDGHNYEEINQALQKAVQNTSGKPFAIVAKTYKGHGISFLENKGEFNRDKQKNTVTRPDMNEAKKKNIFSLYKKFAFLWLKKN